ncbi:glycoside hydrolase family 5 protein [Allorhizobium pseudoryzae]|uniref:glycoside hydrolase family 5 protein n=1 Tax=Allorhizobium pseudoryzae TaxID=379684 RepID=UPI003D07D954
MALSLASSAVAADGACLRGINLAGAEFGTLPGKYGESHLYPSDRTITYFAEKGFNTVRLPFLWERLQPKLLQPFAKEEAGLLVETVRKMRVLGLKVVLDPHNYARYNGKLIGSAAVPVVAFEDFWKRLAEQFGEDPGVMFGLMNEPHDMPAADWLKAANAAIASIRRVSEQNLILVPGTAWTGAHSWFDDWYGGANAATMLSVKDPANYVAFEFHQYFDEDFSGKKDSCSRAAEAIASVAKLSAWLRQNGRQGFMGEFGVTREPACIDAAAEMTAAIDRDRDVWLGWAYWAAGDFWPEDEALNIQPTKKGDRPQLAGLRAALDRPLDPAACRFLQK